MTPLVLAAASAAALAALGVADPKRRRAAGLAPARPRHRGPALGALACCGLGIAASAGPAGAVTWAAAVAAGGWALAQGLALVPAPSWRSIATAGRFRSPPVPVALPVVALICALLAVEGRRGAPPDDAAADRVAALALLDRLERGAPARRAAAPCLAALASARDGGGLRDLLSDRAAAVVLPADGDAGTDLQRCILSAGGEGAATARGGDTATTTIDADTASRVHALIAGTLEDADALAALAPSGGTGAGLVCRRLAAAAGPDVAGFVAALRRDRAYPKAGDLLENLPALEALIDARRAGSPCPA